MRAADRIIALREGRIIEQGDRRGLLAQGGHCAELHNTYLRHPSSEFVGQACRVVAAAELSPDTARISVSVSLPLNRMRAEDGVMSMEAYRKLALHLDALPNGFPPTESGVELRILERIFSPEDAELAAQLRLTLETPAQVAERIGGDPRELRTRLKNMALRGLIDVEVTEHGLVFGALPFVVGIYEYQVASIDQELAQLMEGYFKEGYGASWPSNPRSTA